MKVNEIFYSIQGEGVDTGVPTVFVRLQGCNVVCRWCDTKYALGKGGEELTVTEVVSRVQGADKYPSGRVYVTGGEPLIQLKVLGELVGELHRLGYAVTVATNGTLPRPVWWGRVLWDIDIKCPSSGVDVFLLLWTTTGRKSRLKFVVFDGADLEFVAGMLPGLRGPLCPAVLVSPVCTGGEWDRD